MNPPHQTGELLITADQPWETKAGGHINAHNCVIKEDGRIRVWYDLIIEKRSPGYPTGRCMAYAESEDGIHFTKPKYRLNDLQGFKATNVLIKVSRGGTVWVDPNAALQDRYRSQCKGPDGKLHFFSSSDGVRWNRTHICDIGHCDTQNLAFWDATVGRYVLYSRGKGAYKTAGQYRTVRRLESDDLVHWQKQRIVMQADKTDLAKYKTPTGQPPVDYYAGLVFRYPGADGVYIMMTTAFWHWYDRKPMSRSGPNAIDVRLAVSRDGKTFKRARGRKPFLRLGPAGSFYSRTVWANPNPIRMGDELWIYYWGSNRDHAGHLDPDASKHQTGITRAILRLDGFVSADAEYSDGQIVTPLIRFKGKGLELNLDASAGGSVVVELLDANGRPIKGHTKTDATALCGNSVRMPVSWGRTRNVSKLAGQPIKIRFIMRDCKLYAFQFTN